MLYSRSLLVCFLFGRHLEIEATQSINHLKKVVKEEKGNVKARARADELDRITSLVYRQEQMKVDNVRLTPLNIINTHSFDRRNGSLVQIKGSPLCAKSFSSDSSTVPEQSTNCFVLEASAPNL